MTDIPADVVVRALHLGDVPEGELRHVLEQHFGSARQYPEFENQVEYTRRDAHHGEAFCLRLIYRAGRIENVEPGEDLTQQDLDVLRAKVEESILGDAGSTVIRRVLFSILPVVGWWQYQDRFQIGPVPEESPRPPYVLGDHPFLLEVRLPESTDWMLRNLRAETATREIDLLLGVFLFKVVSGPDSRHRTHWVFLPHTEPFDGTVTSAFLQEGYAAAGLEEVVADDFSTWPDSAQLEEVDDGSYFAIEGIGVGQQLQRPSSLGLLLDAYFDAQTDDRDRFLTFAFWLRFSDTAWSYAMSPSYAALVSAIEALMPPLEPEGACEGCGRSIGPGATRRFIDFIEQWASGIDAQHRRRLYALRSAILHGGKLLLSDQDRWSGMNPQENQERADFRTLQRTATAVGLNWLLGRGMRDHGAP